LSTNGKHGAKKISLIFKYMHGESEADSRSHCDH